MNELSELRAVRAIRAAKNRRAWATMRYLARHGVSVRLYQVAVACEAAEQGDFVEVRRTH